MLRKGRFTIIGGCCIGIGGFASQRSEPELSRTGHYFSTVKPLRKLRDPDLRLRFANRRNQQLQRIVLRRNSQAGHRDPVEQDGAGRGEALRILG